jgi:hypothetical protein
MRELRLETIRVTTKVKLIEVTRTRVQPIKPHPIKGIPTGAMPIRRTPGQDM